MIVFEWLKNWFETNKEKLEQREIIFILSNIVEKTDNPSQNVDIDTKTQMSRITLWETGDCVFEVITNETGKLVIFETKIIKSKRELDSFLNKTFAKL